MEKLDKNADSISNESIEKLNKAAGYNVRLASDMLNSVVVKEQSSYDFGMYNAGVDISTIIDIVAMANGGRLDNGVLSRLLDIAVAYGWHYAKTGESMLRSENVREDIMRFVDANASLTDAQREVLRNGVELGFKAVMDAVKKNEERIKVSKAVKGGRKK